MNRRKQWVLGVLILAPIVIWAALAFAHTSVGWDCNAEVDQVKEYSLKACLATGCDTGTFSKIATVQHATFCPPAPGGATGPIVPLAPLVPNSSGQMKVSATDINNNESLDSNVVTFDTIPPVAVKGVAVR